MLAPTRPPSARARQPVRPPDPPRGTVSFDGRRVRRVLLLTALVLALPALVSYASMLTQASDSSLSIRTVEWLRDNGARGLVNKVENIYYSLNAPATGGPALHALPKQSAIAGALAQARRRANAAYRPPQIGRAHV